MSNNKKRKISHTEIKKLDSWAKRGHTPDACETTELDIVELENLDNELGSLLEPLRDWEKRLLFVLIDNCFSEQSLSNTELSRRARINARDLYKARRNPVFVCALKEFTYTEMVGHCDEIIGHLYRQSALGRTSASKLYFEMSGLYEPVTKTMSVNVNVDAQDMRGKPAEMVREEVVKEWKRMGWEKDEFDKLWEGES